jgi:hypothetical protein
VCSIVHSSMRAGLERAHSWEEEQEQEHEQEHEHEHEGPVARGRGACSIRRMNLDRWMIMACVAMLGACGDHEEGAPSAKPSSAPASTGAPTAAATAKPTASATATTAPAPSGSSSAGPTGPEGKPPPDGKYERVMVDGVTVPMIEVMKGGTVVLVDTDGKKPRTWEEQYKKKREIGGGQFDVHKTDANKDGKFDDDPIDKEGLWVIDEKGNITKH